MTLQVHLHRIPGLSKRFLYLNDDVMFGSPIFSDDFYTRANGQKVGGGAVSRAVTGKVFLAWAAPKCAPACADTWLGNGFCDRACNVTDCDFDGGDCTNATIIAASNRRSAAQGLLHVNVWFCGARPFGAFEGAFDVWVMPLLFLKLSFDVFSFQKDKASMISPPPPPATRFSGCSPGCYNSYLFDKYCDPACKNEACGFDATDCGLDIMRTSMVGYDVTPNVRP